MKKVSRNIFFLALLFILFLGLVPRFLFVDLVKQKVEAKISSYFGGSLSSDTMYWVWLPLPNLTLRDAVVTTEQYTLSLPRMDVFPNWRLIFGESAKPGKIILHSPGMVVHQKAFKSGTSDEPGTSVPVLPEMPVTLKNGALKVEFSSDYDEILRTETLSFNDINGVIKLGRQDTELDLKAGASFSSSIVLKGTYNLPEKKYHFSFESSELKLHEPIKGFFKNQVKPVESTASLSGSFSGTGLDYLEGNLHGTLPCFAVKPKDREILLSCGDGDFKFLKSGHRLRLDIKHFEVKDPQAKLSGYIEGNLSEPDHETVPGENLSSWTIDLAGRNLDLSAIRQKVLTLWPENSIARKVCSIVRGGRATSAAYRFSGSTADFKRLEAMVIEATPLNADIYVPGAKLDLTEASGPILIKDSVLTGQDLSARLGNSYGSNAELWLDLVKNKKGFKLDIDIDADLKDLKPVLARLVKHDNFQQQLAKFRDVSGRASGSLHLGDSLKNITTRVDVGTMTLAGRYEPVPRKLTIAGGRLDIDPGQVKWQDVKGSIGRQEVSRTSGTVSWDSGEVLLSITETKALLEGASFLDLLQRTEVLPPQISDILSDLEGTFEVTRGSLKGPALDPPSWNYDFGLQTAGITLVTPLLPEPVRTEYLAASINAAEAKIEDTIIHFLGQTFNLRGAIQHKHLKDWHGMVVFNGPVMNEMADWIKSNGWLPDKLSPHIPCTVKDMKINWHQKTIGVSGNILQGARGGSFPMAKIDYENSPEHLRINDLSFYAPGEQGSMKLDFWRRSPRKFDLTWNGFVSADTIDALFEYSLLTAGTFSGDFEIHYFADQPEKTRFVGLLKTENLLLKHHRKDVPIIITNLDMTGIGRQLTIPTLNIAVGSEKITGSGQVMAEPDTLQLDMTFQSAFLSKQALESLSRALQESQNIILLNPAIKAPKLKLAGSRDITGRIGFNFDTFRFNRVTNMPYDESRSVTYNFYHVQGDLQFAPDKFIRTEVFSARLCGLNFKGVWFSDIELGQKFHFSTDQGQTLRLENVLPCLGVQQDIIEGEFSLQANLLKESNTWYGGNIYLESSKGRILRLKTLSRVFKVVNITDLFAEQVQTAGKRGYPYSQLNIDSHIKDNNLVIDRALILGEGLNMFARGEIGLADYEADLSLLIAPFKTFDTIISKVPIIGEPVMGEYGSRVNIPVAIKGPITDPEITPLHPEAVGRAFLDLARDTFMLPYNILLKPLEPHEKGADQTPTTDN